MEITNEMIYNSLQELKRDSESLKRDNESIYTSLQDFKKDVDRRFDYMEKRIDRIEHQLEAQEKTLTDLWENREKLKLSLTRSLLTATGILSGVIAIIVSFITGKAIIFSLKN
ncbi:MAG: hypothetical protein AAB373_04055 [Patescibacteria group bacterium]